VVVVLDNRKMRLKTYTFILILLGSIFIFTSQVFAYVHLAEAKGEPTVYKVTMSKFELDNGEGTTAVTASGGTSTVLDIAAGQGGASAGNFMSGLVVPDGSYSRVKPTPSGHFVIAGSISHESSNYRTTGDNIAGGCATTTDPGTPQPCTIDLEVVNQEWKDLGGTITVTNGTPNYKVRVYFDTSEAIGLYGIDGTHAIYPEQPSTTVELIPQ